MNIYSYSDINPCKSSIKNYLKPILSTRLKKAGFRLKWKSNKKSLFGGNWIFILKKSKT